MILKNHVDISMRPLVIDLEMWTIQKYVPSAIGIGFEVKILLKRILENLRLTIFYTTHLLAVTELLPIAYYFQ